MAIKYTGRYCKRAVDRIMWLNFERLARHLGYSVSGAIAAAAREWLDRHENDPSPNPNALPYKREFPDH